MTSHSGYSVLQRCQQAERDLRCTFLQISTFITTLKGERRKGGLGSVLGLIGPLIFT